MIFKDLYNEVLIKPAQEGADDLKIISGYASSAMAFHHLEKLKKSHLPVKISLFVGMCPVDGIALSNHKGFREIMRLCENRFQCSYVFEKPAVHSKLYIWSKKGCVYKSFIGSANYTQNAFYNSQREVLSEAAGNNILDYFNEVEKDTVYCDHLDTDNLVQIYRDERQSQRDRYSDNFLDTDYTGLASVNVSFLDREGNVPQKSGLNWGQRPGRNPNQAYLQLSPEVYKSDFFPIRKTHFTVLTDDSKIFVCTRAQKSEEGHAVETPHNNALLGEYFRYRLDLAGGEKVIKDHLTKYGRTDVTFYKIDYETYYMDFSVK